MSIPVGAKQRSRFGGDPGRRSVRSGYAEFCPSIKAGAHRPGSVAYGCGDRKRHTDPVSSITAMKPQVYSERHAVNNRILFWEPLKSKPMLGNSANHMEGLIDRLHA